MDIKLKRKKKPTLNGKKRQIFTYFFCCLNGQIQTWANSVIRLYYVYAIQHIIWYVGKGTTIVINVIHVFSFLHSSANMQSTDTYNSTGCRVIRRHLYGSYTTLLAYKLFVCSFYVLFRAVVAVSMIKRKRFKKMYRKSINRLTKLVPVSMERERRWKKKVQWQGASLLLLLLFIPHICVSRSWYPEWQTGILMMALFTIWFEKKIECYCCFADFIWLSFYEM